MGALILVLAASLAGVAMTVRGTLSLSPHLPRVDFEMVASDQVGAPGVSRAWIHLPVVQDAF